MNLTLKTSMKKLVDYYLFIAQLKYDKYINNFMWLFFCQQLSNGAIFIIPGNWDTKLILVKYIITSLIASYQTFLSISFQFIHVSKKNVSVQKDFFDLEIRWFSYWAFIGIKGLNKQLWQISGNESFTRWSVWHQGSEDLYPFVLASLCPFTLAPLCPFAISPLHPFHIRDMSMQGHEGARGTRVRGQ